jgi:ribose transport system substrate-binding protein
MRALKWLASAALAATLASPAAAEDFKIGYSVFWGTNPFLVTMVNGAKKAAEEWKAKGVNVDMIVTNGGDNDKAKHYNAENIPVVITDIGIRSGEYISLIITDNLAGGKQAADYMATLVPKGSKVITLDHAPTNDNGQTRQKGFEERAKELGLEVLPEAPVSVLTLDAGRQAMEDLLVSEPDVKGAFAFNQLVLQGAYQALEQAGKTEDVQLVGFDLDPVSFKMVQDGKLDALVVQDPYRMGYEGMNIVLTKLTGGEVEEFIGLGTKLLTKENAAEFANDPQVTGQ